MKYQYLTDSERKHAREVKTQELVGELAELERRHYTLELEFRVAARLENQGRKDAARAAQAALDVSYEALQGDRQAAEEG